MQQQQGNAAAAATLEWAPPLSSHAALVAVVPPPPPAPAGHPPPLLQAAALRFRSDLLSACGVCLLLYLVLASVILAGFEFSTSLALKDQRERDGARLDALAHTLAGLSDQVSSSPLLGSPRAVCDARAQVAAVSDDTVTVARVQTAAIENTLDDNNQALVDALNANNALVAGHLDQVADRVLLLVNTLVNLTRPPPAHA